MAFATELSDTGCSLLGHTDGLLALRVCGTEHDGRVLHIRAPKCTIGADRSCTLRIRGAGVRPFHCLILRGTEGVFVRRLSPDTCLNGGGFDVARLQPTDRLAIGPIELEVLPSPPLPQPPVPIAPATSAPQEPGPDAERAQVCQELSATRHNLETAAAERDAASARVQTLESELRETRHNLESAAAERDAASAHVQTLESESREVRHNVESVVAERDAASARVQTLESELREARHNLESAVAERESAAARTLALEDELSATRQNLSEERTTATHTRGQLEAELIAREQRLTDVHRQLVDREQAAQTNWQDVAEKLRTELQQTRDEHRRVRDEWHVDRQGLERELAARSEALQLLDQKSKQDMREAEMLILSMQQEGKHLLAQLEEARQTIHQDVERRKKRQALAHPGQAHAQAPSPSPAAPASDSPAPDPPATPGPNSPPHAVSPSSACPTMLMDAGQSAQDPPASEHGPADPPTPAPAASTAKSPEPAPAEEAEDEDDENVIQRYMERLLRRVGRT